MTSRTEYYIRISSPPDREKLVAEIFVDGAQWAELNQEESDAAIEFYPRPDGAPWRIPLAIALAAIAEAQRRLGL